MSSVRSGRSSTINRWTVKTRPVSAVKQGCAGQESASRRNDCNDLPCRHDTDRWQTLRHLNVFLSFPVLLGKVRPSETLSGERWTRAGLPSAICQVQAALTTARIARTTAAGDSTATYLGNSMPAPDRHAEPPRQSAAEADLISLQSMFYHDHQGKRLSLIRLQATALCATYCTRRTITGFDSSRTHC